MSFIFRKGEEKMDPLKWCKIAEVQGRLDADLIKSLLEANGIDAELIQEALGHSLIPVAINGLGRVQIFIPKEKVDEALSLLRNIRGSMIIFEP
jgi:hypothetical protein